MNGAIYVEINNPKGEFCNPVWWDNWVRKNLKKKMRLFSKIVSAVERD
jgi:hypothetical protein